MYKTVLAALAATTIGGAAQAAQIDSVICSEKVQTEKILAAVMATPSLQADADTSEVKATIDDLVDSGSCRIASFPATGADLSEHPEGGVYLGLVELNGEWAIEIDFELFRRL